MILIRVLLPLLGNDISSLKGKDLHDFRKTAQMIFQDPQASLNGRMKIRDIIAEGLIFINWQIQGRT